MDRRARTWASTVLEIILFVLVIPVLVVGAWTIAALLLGHSRPDLEDVYHIGLLSSILVWLIVDRRARPIE